MKKRLIALMISMFLAVTAAGCGGEDAPVEVDEELEQKYNEAYDNSYNIQQAYDEIFKDVSIMVNGEDVLHKGDISSNISYYYHSYYYHSDMKLCEFDCGKKLITNEKVTIYDVTVADDEDAKTTKPLEGNQRPDNIDLCPGCFGVE